MKKMTDKNHDFLKLSFDWCKHVSTLSTASIMITVTFLDKLLIKPSLKELIAISLVSFLLSILGTFGVQFEHLVKEDYYADLTIRGKISASLMLLGFLSGISSLIIFTIINI